MRDLTTLDGLLAEQMERADCLDAAIDYTDSLDAVPNKEKAFRNQYAVTELLDAIVLEICAYRPKNSAEQADKAKALIRWMGNMDSLTRPECVALINSMVDGGEHE